MRNSKSLGGKSDHCTAQKTGLKSNSTLLAKDHVLMLHDLQTPQSMYYLASKFKETVKSFNARFLAFPMIS